jgi:hypothetical protein
MISKFLQKDYPLNRRHENANKPSYQRVFCGSEIHHANTGIRVTNDWFMKGYLTLSCDLTRESVTPEEHEVFQIMASFEPN